MKRILILLFLFSISVRQTSGASTSSSNVLPNLTPGFITPTPTPSNPTDGCESLRQTSIVSVFASRGSYASGSVVANKGQSSLVLTNHHVVVRVDQSLHVKLLNGQSYSGVVVADNADDDLALIKIDAILPPVKLASSLPNSGEAVRAIGNPKNRPGTVTDGQMLGPGAYGRIYHTADLRPGSSGSPLLNSTTCEQVAVNEGEVSRRGVPADEGKSVAIPINLVTPFVAQAIAQPALSEIQPKETRSGIERRSNLKSSNEE